jgi:MATE family multidrug resistance protein
MRLKIFSEIKAMTKLALPVVADNLASMGAGVVAVLLAGRINKESLGALGIGSSLLFFFLVFGFSTISGIVPIVAQAFGANRKIEIEESTAQGFWVAILLSVIGFVILRYSENILIYSGQNLATAKLASQYIFAGSFGIFSGMFYSVLRSFILGLGKSRLTMIIAFSGFLTNSITAYILVTGKFGFNKYGIIGCGYAFSTAVTMELIICFFIVSFNKEFQIYNFRKYILIPNYTNIITLLKLGLPIAISASLEYGVFNFVNLLMGRLGTVPLASHQIAINVAALTFMVPWGISIATSTRVGHAIGRDEPHSAKLSGWVGISLGTGFMFLTALSFFLFSEDIVALYSTDLEVIKYSSSLLIIAGGFQIFDGIQVTSVGASRGLKDTQRPMITNLISYWLIGLPLGYLLAIHFKFGGFGYWLGLTFGLMIAAILHTLRFKSLINKLI